MKTLSLSKAIGLFAVILLAVSEVRVSVAAEAGVRIRFGLTDKEATEWDGSVSVSPGKVVALSGWRFEQGDQASGTTGWQAATRGAVDTRTNAQKAKAKAAANPDANGNQKAKGKGKGAAAKAKAKAGANIAGLADNGVLLTLTDVTESSLVTVKTAQGNFEFKLSDIPYGKYIEKLDGAVEVERIAAARPLTADAKTDDDYPSAAVAADGTAYVAYTNYTPGLDRNERYIMQRQMTTEPQDLRFLSTAPGGDQLLIRSIKSGTAGEAIAVTEKGADIYKSAVAVAGDGTVWVFWSQNKNYKPFPNNPASNFDIWARSLKDGKLGEATKISESTENDVWPVAATDSAGKVWVAWQGARDKVFRILSRHQSGNGWSPEQVVSTQSRNCWAPAIATTSQSGGKVAIAWDTYEKGDYDIYVREYDNSGKAGDARAVANTDDYEARPALTYDKQGALWIAYEESGATWGKDWSGAAPYDNRNGIGLYRDRQIGLVVLKEGKWMEPAQLVAQGLPGPQARRRTAGLPTASVGPGGETIDRAPAQNVFNNIARLTCDAGGRIWVLTRTRHGDFRAETGTVWMSYATFYDGNQWVGPTLVPHSDNLIYNSPAIAPLPGGGVFIAHSSDHRQDRYTRQAGPQRMTDPIDNDLFVSRLETSGDAKPPALVASKVLPDPSAQPSEATRKEREDLDRIRAYRGPQGTRIVRGEFHRHTEISPDGIGDGPLEDMWRYAIDVASMEWLGNSDHDNGNGREYTWWLTQKTTDAFTLAGRFDPPYVYERSVRYPEGHRNVIFTKRGIRTLPRLPITDRDNVVHAPDTQMLYKYLKFYDGVCASHTSATGMGTDWRDNDPAVETMVEIYQGDRQNYERPGAPRSPSEGDSIGGWEPKGFVNLALLKGYKFSFECSSDHLSTHLSYAMVLAENSTREAVQKAMKLRHTYGATDNIVADYRCKADGKEYIMGDEFKSSQPPTVTLKLVGTAPFKKVTLVKDDVEHVLGEPNKADVDYTWTDPKPTAGKESYYYVRGEQADGELVWVSPMWITYQPK
jgi:hypothetical protein